MPIQLSGRTFAGLVIASLVAFSLSAQTPDTAKQKPAGVPMKKYGDVEMKRPGDVPMKKYGDVEMKKPGDVPMKKYGDVEMKKSGDVPMKKYEGVTPPAAGSNAPVEQPSRPGRRPATEAPWP